jgi:hypothetical protein
MYTRNLADNRSYLHLIEIESKKRLCPTCQGETDWKYGDVIQARFHPVTDELLTLAVLACKCGYTMLIQPTPENGLKFSR